MTVNPNFIFEATSIVDEKTHEYIERVKRMKGKELKLNSEFIKPLCDEVNKLLDKYHAKKTEEADKILSYFNYCVWSINFLVIQYEREAAEKETLSRLYV